MPPETRGELDPLTIGVQNEDSKQGGHRAPTPDIGGITRPKIRSATLFAAAAAAAIVIPLAATPPGSGATVDTTVHATGKGHELAVESPSARQRLLRIKFYWFDGYNKVVTIAGGEHVSDINVANCVRSVHGVNDKCHPRLSNVDKEAALTGSLTGEETHENRTIHETSTGTGSVMSVGHRNHGALIRLDLKWANGGALRILVPGKQRVTDIGFANSSATAAQLSNNDTRK